jgi:hypothetical protein
MKRTIAVVLFFLAGTSLFAVPPSLRDHPGGWFDITVGVSLTLPDLKPNFGLHFHGAGAENWGFGLSLVAGWSMLDLTLNVVHYFDFPGAPEWSVPVYLKIGLLSLGLGVGVEAGLKWFFGGVSTPTATNAGYFNGEVLGGVHLIVYSLYKDERSGRTAGFGFWPVPLIGLNLGFAGQMPESNYVW